MNESIIICKDCIDAMDERRANTVDLVVTSPPWNLNVAYDNCSDNLLYPEYLSWCRRWLLAASRLLKPDGFICVNYPGVSLMPFVGRVSTLMDLYGMLPAAGLEYFGNVTWFKPRKEYPEGGRKRKRYLGTTHCDGILVARKPGKKPPLPDEVYDQTNEIFMGAYKGLWSYRSAPETLDKLNPAPWPVEIPSRCIKLLSKEGDIVLDPFCGSGSTCVAAQKLNRRYIGIDISEKYCAAAAARIAEVRFEEKPILSETHVLDNLDANAGVEKLKKPKQPKYGHPRFYDLLKELADTHSRKSHDYSGPESPLQNFYDIAEFMDIPAYKVCAMFLAHKMTRIKTLLQHPPEVVGESIKDTLRDLAVYSLLNEILYEEHERDTKIKTT